jgi:HK97 family phage portal protein
LKVTQGTLTQDAADTLRSSWNAAHGGPGRATAILSPSVDYTPIAVSPVDAALVEMKRLSLLDVANAFGVPGYMLGAEGPSMTYSNVEMEAANLYEFTLKPWAVSVEETLSALLPGTQTVNIRVEGGTVSGTVPATTAGDFQPVADVPEG